MSTQIQARHSNIVDAGLDASYFTDRGFTVTGSNTVGQVTTLTLAEDLTDLQKDELARNITADLSLIRVDVSDPGDTVTITKRRYNRVIDRGTEVVIRRGFTFNAKNFAMDTLSQLRAIRYFTVRTVITYPFTIPTSDNLDGEAITDQTELETFYQALNVALFTAEQNGRDAKQNVVAAGSAATAKTAAETYLTTNNVAYLIPDLGT